MSKITYKEIDSNNIKKENVSVLARKLFDLEKEHYTYKNNSLSEKYHKESFLSDLKRGQKYFLVFSGDRLVGRARVNVFDKEVILNHILISPKYQNKGVGKRLLIRILGYSKKHDCRNVIFNVANSKMHSVSKAVTSRNTQRSSTKYKYVGNTKYVNHDMQSVINIKKEPKPASRRPGK
jgi:GNAT superfamily N-acetyltransferase